MPKGKKASSKKAEKPLTEVSDAQDQVAPAPGEGEKPTIEQAPPSGSTSAKKGKKKKLSAKERRRQKAEALAREEERLRQEKANQEAERQRELERSLELAQKQRLEEEDNTLMNFRTMRAQNRASIRAEAAKTSDWQRYIMCNHATNPLDKADVNSFVSIWEEAEDTDIAILFQHITIACKLIDQLTELRYQADVATNADDYERYSRHINDIRWLIQKKIEALTVHHILFSDKYTGAKSEVLLSADAAGYAYGLWVNIAKNPRIKDIDFGITSVEIPKPVAMASLAIRMKLSPIASEFDDYCLLSPIMACEFFQLPPPPKRVSTYVLRQCSTTSLTPVAYPLKNNTNPQPPLVFKMKIDPDRLPENMEGVTVIKIDDIEHSSELVSDVNFNMEERFVTFSCKTTGTFAVAISKWAHFPLQFWEINSPAADTVEIFIRTPLTELTMTIDKNGLVSMETPIQFTSISAAAAITLLQTHGINLIAPEDPSKLGEESSKVAQKPAALEDVFLSGIADTATGFRVRASKWNSQITRGSHEDPRIMFLAREITTFGEPITEDEAVEEEEAVEQAEEGSQQGEQAPSEESVRKKEEKPTKWRCIQGTQKHITTVPNAEGKDQPIMQSVDETQFHQYVMPTLMDIASDEVRERVNAAPAFIAEALKYILEKLRLFSMTV